jgi:PhzF family phenazine biosynthesis protein
MQRIARWTNLSETTFVLPPTAPEASYRVRIFTPRQELPFAGHPSLGTAHAVLEAGVASAREGRLVQECGAGLLPVRIEIEDGVRRLFVRAPDARFGNADSALAQALAAALGAPVQTTPAPRAVNVGPTWIVAQLPDGAAVRALAPDMGALVELSRAHDAVGVTVFGDGDDDARFAVRSFAPIDGIPEDPVCGSGNAAIGAFLREAGQLPGARWVVSQGRECNREGRVWTTVGDDGAVEVGGRTTTRIDGLIRLD